MVVYGFTMVCFRAEHGGARTFWGMDWQGMGKGVGGIEVSEEGGGSRTCLAAWPSLRAGCIGCQRLLVGFGRARG